MTSLTPTEAPLREAPQGPRTFGGSTPPRVPGTEGAYQPAASSHVFRTGNARRGVWATAAVFAVGLVLWGQSLGAAPLCLALSAMAAAALVADRGGPGLGFAVAIPTGLLVLVSWVILWGLATSAVGLGAWETRGAALAGMALFAAFTGGIARHRGGAVELRSMDLLALAAFAGLLGFWVWVIATQPLALWSRINSTGTDFMRHLWFTTSTRDGGGLTFAEASYPRAFHALGAWLTSALDVPTTADALWRACAPLALLMLGLILMAVMGAAAQLAEAMVGTARSGHVAALLAAAAFLQTAWFSTFLSFGNVMNMLLGVVLITLMSAGLQPRVFGSRSGTVVCATSLAVTANSWQLLLPVVVAGSVPWIVQFLRFGRRRALDWVVWCVCCLLTVHGALGVLPNARSASGVVQTVAVPTVSSLFRPDWWWWVALSVGVAVAVVAYWKGLRAWALATLASLFSAAVLVAGVVLMTSSSWDLLRYYPAKALWTCSVLVLPVAAGGFVWLATLLWSRAGASPPGWGIGARGLLGLAFGVLVISIAGRGAADSPHLAAIGQGRAGLPNWSLAMLDSMNDRTISASARQGAIVFGLVPSGSLVEISGGYVGMVDYMAMESLRFLGIEGADGAPVKSGLATRNMTEVCRYLMDFPDSLRLTGPNPAAGPQWIIDSGCPEAIVQPERWISLDIDPVWFERSPWEDGNWEFPLFDATGAERVRV